MTSVCILLKKRVSIVVLNSSAEECDPVMRNEVGRGSRRVSMNLFERSSHNAMCKLLNLIDKCENHTSSHDDAVTVVASRGWLAGGCSGAVGGALAYKTGV